MGGRESCPELELLREAWAWGTEHVGFAGYLFRYMIDVAEVH
jgi:hypothetical protein